MSDVECPYCGHEQYINHDDGYGYDEDETYQQTCCECEKEFAFTTSIIFHYRAEQSECMNGGEHDYRATHTYPVQYTILRCTSCGQEKELSREIRDRLKALINDKDTTLFSKYRDSLR